MEINKVFLSGNLTKNPEYKITESGTKICNFRIANNRKSKDGKRTIFVDIVSFNTLAENCQKYLQKGDLVVVEGVLQIRNYEKKYFTEIIADEVNFVKVKKLNEPKKEVEKLEEEIQYDEPVLEKETENVRTPEEV